MENLDIEAEAATDRYFRSKAASVPGRMADAIQPLLDRLSAAELDREVIGRLLVSQNQRIVAIEKLRDKYSMSALPVIAQDIDAALGVTPTPQETCRHGETKPHNIIDADGVWAHTYGRFDCPGPVKRVEAISLSRSTQVAPPSV